MLYYIIIYIYKNINLLKKFFLIQNIITILTRKMNDKFRYKRNEKLSNI